MLVLLGELVPDTFNFVTTPADDGCLFVPVLETAGADPREFHSRIKPDLWLESQ